ncbi:MAG: EF-hand domain-containing protein [Chthoniobacter sp.]
MKTKLLILGMAITLPSLAAWAEAPRGPGKGGPPPGPRGNDERGGQVHDDPHRNPIMHALLKAIDTDGDGVISMTEMNHAPESLLTLDKDGDGKLSDDELRPPAHRKDGPKDGKDKPEKADKPDAEKGDKTAADKDKDAPADDKKPHPDKGPGDGPKDGPVEDEQRSALVDAIDTNHDGRISAEEIAASRANLKKLDMNHDGKLTPPEYGQHRHP